MRKQYSLDLTNQSNKIITVSVDASGLTFSDKPFQSFIPGSTGSFSIKTNNDTPVDSTGDYSLSGGYGTIVNGDYSLGYGVNNEVNSPESIGVGTGNILNGNRDYVIGYYNNVNGTENVVIGSQNIVTLDSNFVGGAQNDVNGLQNTVFGLDNTVNSDGSNVFGFRNNSSSTLETIIGRYNKIITGSSSWINTDSIFTIGNGINDGSGRSDAFRILKNGTIILTQPATMSTSENFLMINSQGVIEQRDKNSLQPKNTYIVSDSGGDFTTIGEAVYFVNNLIGTQGITIKLDSGTHYMTDTIEVNSTHPITITGDGINCCNLVEYDELGSDLFILYTECNFNGINFVGFGQTSNCINTVNILNHEILNCNFDYFNYAVLLTKSSLFIHNFIITNCNKGIYTVDTYFNKLDAEVGDFTNCGIGIHLFEGKNAIFDIHSCIFNPGAGNIGIVYDPSNYNYSDHPTIQSNKWDNTGTFYSGFDFTRADGRDKDIVIFSNVGSEDKLPHAWLNMINNTTPTTVVNNVWTKLNYTGNTLYENKIIFNGNRFTYLPTNRRDLMVWGSGTFTTSTQLTNIEVALVKNGLTSSIISPISITMDSNSRKFQWSANAYLGGVESNDYFELYSRGIGSNETIILEDFNLLIKSM